MVADEMNNKSFEQLIQEKNVLAKKQAVMKALITKKMDPKKQGKEVAEAFIRSIKMFGEVIQNDPKRVEDAEFMD